MSFIIYIMIKDWEKQFTCELLSEMVTMYEYKSERTPGKSEDVE